MTVKKNWMLAGVALLIGFFIGGFFSFYYTTYFTTKFFVDSAYSSFASEIIIDISVLKQLRNGDINNAIDMLDDRIDRNIITLNTDDVPISQERKNSIENVLNLAYEYKKKYNLKNNND